MMQHSPEAQRPPSTALIEAPLDTSGKHDRRELARLLRASERAIREHVQWLQAMGSEADSPTPQTPVPSIAELLEKAEELCRAAEAQEIELTEEPSSPPESKS